MSDPAVCPRVHSLFLTPSLLLQLLLLASSMMSCCEHVTARAQTHCVLCVGVCWCSQSQATSVCWCSQSPSVCCVLVFTVTITSCVMCVGVHSHNHPLCAVWCQKGESRHHHRREGASGGRGVGPEAA